jgi:hypothetical protein
MLDTKKYLGLSIMPLEKFLELMLIIKQNLDKRDAISAEKDARIDQLLLENVSLQEQLAEALNKLAGALANDAADAAAIKAAEDASNTATDQLLEARKQLEQTQLEFAQAAEKTRLENDAILSAIAEAQAQFAV